MTYSLKLSCVALLAWLSVIFHIYLVFSGLIPNLVTRPLHLLLALPWIFFIGIEGSRNSRYMGYMIGSLAIVAVLYVLFNHNELSDQYGSLYTNWQFFIAVVLLLSVLEMARRAIKWPLPLAAAIALCYGIFGHHIPGLFGYAHIPLASFLGTLTIAEGGIWGSLTGISATVVAIFVIFGAIISGGEAGNGFMALATRLAGGYRGGAAKVSVVSSALFGSISGSASANVASTGAITLPTMKRLGYPKTLAAAVEAVASTGGQIMPPLMGAGAFVMVELLQVPYTTIMQAAILPSLLFFYAVWVGIDGYAKRFELQAMGKNLMPSNRELWTTMPFFVLPFGLLLFLLFVYKFTAQLAAGFAIFLAAAMLITDRHYRVSIRAGWQRLNTSVLVAAKQISSIAAIIICASIIIGVLHQTGLGIKVTSLIIAASGGELWVALLLTALACLILGMEVPTTAAYLICISVAGPALQELGVPLLHAHFFVFWYALLSTITPPVCGTVFIASGMANASWTSTAGIAMKLGLGLYLIPLSMMAQPELLTPLDASWMPVVAFVRIALALWLLSHALISRRSIFDWMFLSYSLFAGFLMFYQHSLFF